MEQYVVGGIYDVFVHSSQQVVRIRIGSCSSEYVRATYVGDHPAGRRDGSPVLFFPHHCSLRSRVDVDGPINLYEFVQNEVYEIQFYDSVSERTFVGRFKIINANQEFVLGELTEAISGYGYRTLICSIRREYISQQTHIVVPDPILSRECFVGDSYEIEQTIFSQARTYTIRVTAVDDTEVHGTFVMPQHGLPEGQPIHLLHQFITNVRSFSDSPRICGVPVHAGSEYAFQYRNYPSPFYVRVSEVRDGVVHGIVTVTRIRPLYGIGDNINLSISEVERVTLVTATAQRPPSSAAWTLPQAEPGREKKKWVETAIRFTS